MCLRQRQIFHGHRIFSIFFMCRASNQSILSLRLASTTADLIPYPFGSGIEEQIPVLPSRIQVPVPALILIALKYCIYMADVFNISIANSLHYAYITFQKLGIAWGTLNPQGWIEGCPQICINFYNSATIEFRAFKFIVLKFSIDSTTGVDLRGVYI